MDEQAKKINGAIGALRRARDDWRAGGATGTGFAGAAWDLLDALPVEGWPEQLPTMREGSFEHADLIERFRSALMREHAVDWSMDTVSEAAHICARSLVEPPKPSTRKVPWWEALGCRLPGGGLVTEVKHRIDAPLGAVLGGSCGWVAADAAGLVEVLDTETGAPE